MEAAQQYYEQATLDYRRLMELHQELGMASADGRYALSRAAGVQRRALQAYAQALREYMDFVIEGRPPSDSGE